MPSIVPSYEYDIFISYRQKDNKRDGWVTEFIDTLKDEIEATFKEDISIYFDENPHDGLLETHDVDDSLREKLKCLIFIPIVSQTYCDPNCFAWEHEFKVFVEQSGNDQFGLKTKLSGGNVASRVLPVKIHDLESEDQQLFESEVGGVMRSIDFIYKETGVNRPLTPDDSEEKNFNGTKYKNQINKVANAIKELITGIKGREPEEDQSAETFKNAAPLLERKPKRKNKVLLTTIAAIVILALAYFIYNNRIKNDVVVDEIEKSIAVLPFIDLTESKNQGWFADGLTEEILNSLAHVNGLHVISRTSSFTFKNKNLRIQTIADSLQVNFIVEGSVRKSDQGMRITAQLIRAKDEFQIWSNTYDRNSKDIFVVQQDIASNIARSLDISLDPKAIEQMQWAGTKNADAYIAFLKGRELDEESHRADEFIDLAMLEKANTYYEESIKLDPYFLNAYLYHADFFLHYILKDDPRYQSTLTESHAYKMFMDDLGNTVSRSKDESQKDYFRIAQIMYSNDWTNFREVIEKSLNSPDAVKNFTYQNFGIRSVIIILGYGNQFSAIHNKILENDPSGIATRGIVANLIYWGKYNEALQEISKNEGSIQLKIYSLYQLGKMDEAYDLISKMESSGTNYYSLKAMILVKKGRNQEAKEIMSVEHERGGFYLMAIDAVFGRQAANKEANLLDQKALLDFPLFVGIAYSPNNPPFDFSATPNFARRLKQAGIEINSK